MGSNKTPEMINSYEVAHFDGTELTWENAPENIKKVADTTYDRSGEKRYVDLDITNYINKKLVADPE